MGLLVVVAFLVGAVAGGAYVYTYEVHPLTQYCQTLSEQHQAAVNTSKAAQRSEVAAHEVAERDRKAVQESQKIMDDLVADCQRFITRSNALRVRNALAKGSR